MKRNALTTSVNLEDPSNLRCSYSFFSCSSLIPFTKKPATVKGASLRITPQTSPMLIVGWMILLYIMFICDAVEYVHAANSYNAANEKSESFSPPIRSIVAQLEKGRSEKKSKSESIAEMDWKSQELDILGIGMSVGDVDGDGKQEIVIIDPTTVYLYKFSSEGLNLLTDYSPQSLELKSVDVAKIRPQGPARIYVSAQNRGAVSSFVLEYRNGSLVPVVQDFGYFLRVISYPTRGPILLGQKKGMTRMYEGPIMQMIDKGNEIEPQGRFGVPLKIPIFGFAIGDFEGRYRPLLAVYDRQSHLRIYEPSGKRLYVTKDYYGESDVILRKGGHEERVADLRGDEETEFFRPRILSLDFYNDSIHQILAITHSSKTRRLLSRTKMLEEGQIIALEWNGDSLMDKWATPKIQGMITDFSVASLPGLPGTRLITLERKRTDWLAFLRSKSQVRAYDLKHLMEQGLRRSRSREE